MFHDRRLGDDAHDVQMSQTSNILLRLKYLRRKREMSFFLCDLHFLFSIKSNLTRITKDVVISSIRVFVIPYFHQTKNKCIFQTLYLKINENKRVNIRAEHRL